MLARERVITVIEGAVPDRIPVYGWVRANLADPITKEFGSVETFEDHYEFDLAHLFGGPSPIDAEALRAARRSLGRPLEPADALELPIPDPDEEAAYESIRRDVAHHKRERGRFVYMQTPGFFEGHNGIFGIENHLTYLLLYPDQLSELYRRRVEWDIAFANNCLDLGVDMIHLSDDWGAQNDLMFRYETWQTLIQPHMQAVVDAVRRRGGYVSLHSDGNINRVVDDIAAMGFHVVHPWQESAGMSLQQHHDQYRDRFVVMGGLDVQNTIGFGKLDRLVSEIERVMRLYADGGLLFCTTHFVQNHCSMEELRLAFDTAVNLSRRVRAS